MTAPALSKSALFRFRPGALDAIAQARNLHSERQLAAILCVTEDELSQLRHGAIVGAPMALHVSTLMGLDNYIGAWFDRVTDEQAA